MTRPFRFGLQSFNATSPQDWRDQARHAEALGFSTFSVADHVIGPGPALAATNHPVQDIAAIPAMAVAIEATSTITIGSRVFCTDYRQPVMFAKELATLAYFAEGRLEIGLGAGWLQGEYEAMGVPWEPAGVRIDRMEETIALIRAHFADGEIDVDGTHVHAVGFEGVPKVPTGPAADHDRRGSTTRARHRRSRGRHREPQLRQQLRQDRTGRCRQQHRRTHRAEDRVDPRRRRRSLRRPRARDRAAYFTVVTDDRDGTLAKMAPMFGLEPEVFAEHPHALIGSVDSICDQLVERRETYGISYVTFAGRMVDAVAPIVERLAGT